MRNVLLMLSTKEPPHPVDEVNWHGRSCAANGTTTLVTTRVLDGMIPGRSTVAFYGDAALQNRFLGRAVFNGYVRGAGVVKAFAANHPLYGTGIPGNAQGLIRLTNVVVASPQESLADLRGTIEKSGLELILPNIPSGPARIQVYYRT